MRVRKGRCAHCGKKSSFITDDHVVPKCLFPKPRPHLVTVPACRKCNAGMSQDEEYFKEVVLRRDDIPQTEITKQLNDSLFRSAMYNRGPMRQIERQLYRIPDQVIDGVFRTGLVVIKPDFPRLDRVAKKIATGIYYLTHGEPMSASHKLEVIWRNGTRDNLSDQQNEAIVAMLELLRQHSDMQFIGKQDVFVFRHAVTTENPYSAAWHLGFFGVASFVLVSLPHSVFERQATKPESS